MKLKSVGMFGTVDRPLFLLWEGEDNNSVYINISILWMTKMSSGRYTEEERMASDRFRPTDMTM